MISFVKDSGNDKVFAKIIGLEKLMAKGIRRGSHKSGQSFVAVTSREIRRKPKSGRTYIINRRRHIASAPGETHANLTGAALRSLSFKAHGSMSLEVGYGVTTGKKAPKYVGFLEFGTKKMAARPSVQNGIEATQDIMVKHFQDEVLAALA